MADLILECVREERRDGLEPEATERLSQIAARLSPDNIEARPTRTIEAPDLRAAIVNPSPEGVYVAEGGIMLGVVIGPAGHWWQVGAEPPDGTYALARYSAATVELVTDATASRTLWYAHDERRLIVSTSQRAVVAMLGDLSLNREAVTWFLMSGTLGPDSVWDTRVRRLPSDSRLTLDRRTWQTKLVQRPAVFAPGPGSDREHLDRLREAVGWSCANLDIDPERWLLPLSGGRDSRAILDALTRCGRPPKCVTWTTRASTRRPLTDAHVARVVARCFHAEHRYAFFDGSSEGLGAALQRFVELGEGSTDAFAAYVDGCAMWRDLFNEGVYGVIRGDEPLVVRIRMASYDGARMHAHGALVADYPKDHLVCRLGLAEQQWPRRLRPQAEEGPSTYRDRLSHQAYIPYALAPLTEIKCRYVEVANPLLSRRVIAVARAFPEALRRYGRALPAIVEPKARLDPAREVRLRPRRQHLPRRPGDRGDDRGHVDVERDGRRHGRASRPDAARRAGVARAHDSGDPPAGDRGHEAGEGGPAFPSEVPSEAALPRAGYPDGLEAGVQSDRCSQGAGAAARRRPSADRRGVGDRTTDTRARDRAKARDGTLHALG